MTHGPLVNTQTSPDAGSYLAPMAPMLAETAEDSLPPTIALNEKVGQLDETPMGVKKPTSSVPPACDLLHTSVEDMDATLTSKAVQSESSTQVSSLPPAYSPPAPLLVTNGKGQVDGSISAASTKTSQPAPKKRKIATPAKSASLLDENHEDDEVRKLPGAPAKPKGHNKVKLEPGTSPARTGPAPKRRKNTNSTGLPKRTHALISPATAPIPGPGVSPPPPARATNLSPTDYTLLHAELDEVDNLLAILPNSHGEGPAASAASNASPSTCTYENDLPPAYAPPAKSIEQIIQEANASLEERIYSRISKDIAKTGNKRNRAVLSLDEAEDNLRQASSDYAKAKATEERKAAAKQRKGYGGGGPGKKEDDADSNGNGGKSGKKGGGEKSGYDW